MPPSSPRTPRPRDSQPAPVLPADPIAQARAQWVAHGWEDAADGMSAVTSIMRVQQILLARIEATLRPHGVSFARYEMLRLLAFTRDGRMAMNRARRLLQVHPTSVTSIADRLERDGLVERVPHPSDGRSTLLALTRRGAAVAEAATADLNADVFTDVGFEIDDQARLTHVLARFRRDAGDFTDPPPAPPPL